MDTNNYLIGANQKSLLILTDLFGFISYLDWKIEIHMKDRTTNAMSNSFIQIRKNQLPYGGSCTVDKTVGYTMSTLFVVKCQNWRDDDGSIQIYEYYGKIELSLHLYCS